MLQQLLTRVDAVLARIDPVDDRGWLEAPSQDDWSALYQALPEARDSELDVWFRWHNGQAMGHAVLRRDLGPLRRVREQGRLLSLAEALELREQLLGRQDGERFRQALPLFALPEKHRDHDGTSRFVVYQVAGREAGNLVHTLTLSPNADVWPVAGPRDDDGRAGLAVWANSLLVLEAAVFGPFDELELAQRWVLAAPVVRALWHGDTGRFGYGPRAGAEARNAAFVLRADWGVRNPADLRALLESHFQAEVDAAPGAQAWHWGTIGAAAEFGYQAGYCPAQEAWSVAVAAARKLQACFSSWREYLDAYLGERRDRGDAQDSTLQSETILLRPLLDDPRHPWSSVPWNTPLPAELVLPAPAPHKVWSVSQALELHSALLEAGPGDVIRLAKGHYGGSFSPADFGLTLIGEPGVVLEALTEEPALSGYHGIAVQNIELRATGTVVVNHSVYLRLQDCRIVGGDDGIISYSADEEGTHDYEVQLIRCVVKDSGDRGVVIEDGFAFLQDCQIQGTGGHAITARARAAGLYLHRCEISDAGGAGVRAFGSPNVRLDDVVIRSAAGIGVLSSKGASVELIQTKVSDCGGRGLFVNDGGSLFASRTRIQDSVGANVDLADCGDVSIVQSEIYGGQWGGVYLHPATGARFSECEILGSKLVSVFADGGVPDNAPLLQRCVLGESLEASGIFVTNGAVLRTTGTTIRATPGMAVEVAASRFSSDGLTIDGCAGGVIVHGGGELRLKNTEVTNSTGSALIVQGARALIDGLLVRGGQRGITVGQDGHAVAAACAFSDLEGAGPDADDQERGFAILIAESSSLVLLGGSIVGDGGDDAIQVMSDARLVAKGLNVQGAGVCGIRASGAHLHLVDGAVTGGRSAGILLDKGATSSILRTQLSGQAFSAVEVRAEATLLLRDATLTSGPTQSAVFAHSGARVIVHGGDFKDTVRAIATEDTGVVEELEGALDGLSGILADLVAALAGPHLAAAEEAIQEWRARDQGAATWPSSSSS